MARANKGIIIVRIALVLWSVASIAHTVYRMRRARIAERNAKMAHISDVFDSIDRGDIQ